jgi:hypothetical protein
MRDRLCMIPMSPLEGRHKILSEWWLAVLSLPDLAGSRIQPVHHMLQDLPHHMAL